MHCVCIRCNIWGSWEKCVGILFYLCDSSVDQNIKNTTCVWSIAKISNANLDLPTAYQEKPRTDEHFTITITGMWSTKSRQWEFYKPTNHIPYKMQMVLKLGSTHWTSQHHRLDAPCACAHSLSYLEATRNAFSLSFATRTVIRNYEFFYNLMVCHFI